MTTPELPPEDRLLTTAEVAEAFRIHPRTVGRWAERGWIRQVRPGNAHPRYRESDVRALLAGEVPDATR